LGIGLPALDVWMFDVCMFDVWMFDVWMFNDGAREFFRRHGFMIYNQRLWSGE
jgi:hypothetical protein